MANWITKQPAPPPKLYRVIIKQAAYTHTFLGNSTVFPEAFQYRDYDSIDKFQKFWNQDYVNDPLYSYEIYEYSFTSVCTPTGKRELP